MRKKILLAILVTQITILSSALADESSHVHSPINQNAAIPQQEIIGDNVSHDQKNPPNVDNTNHSVTVTCADINSSDDYVRIMEVLMFLQIVCIMKFGFF